MKPFFSISSFLVALAALSWGVRDLSAFEAAAARPNILLIMADDLGVETLGCYGGESYKTPCLNRLADSGTRFQHCYAMPVCHPTRVCLFTGRYPFRLNNPRWGTFPKNTEPQTLGRVMQRAGYATAVAGKWQLTMLKDDTGHPHRLGFDEYCLFGWHEGPRYHQPLLWQNGKLRRDVKDRFGPDVYCDFLIDFMSRNKDRPFFAYYPMALCHDVTDDLDEPVPFGPDGRYLNYKEMTEAMDARVGRVVAALDRLKLREKTLVLFTGDNGTPKSYIHTAVGGKYIRKPVVSRISGRDVPGGKGLLTDAGTRVPLIASWRGVLPEGKVVDDLVDFSDFLPTLLDLAGGQTPQGVQLDGQSFAARLRGDGPGKRQWALSQSGARHFARDGRWKLYNNGRLFDVDADSLEKHPLDAESEPAEAAAARKRLQAALDGLTTAK